MPFTRQQLTNLQRGQANLSKPLTGRPSPGADLTEGQKAALPYVRGFLAAARTGTSQELSSTIAKRLAVGTTAMQSTRSKLDLGRGNVDAFDPRFPQASKRTAEAYSHGETDPFYQTWTGQATTAEMARAGNCDHHGASSALYVGRTLDANSHVAKVVSSGHAFAEIRGPQGDTQTRPDDVIVDSWASNPHAVLRQDSEFADTLSPTISPENELADHPGGHTHQVWNQAQGIAAGQLNNQLRAQHPLIPGQIDAVAHLPHAPAQDMWGETSMLSTGGQQSTNARADVFQHDNNFLRRNLQTVQAARQMGGSVRGAVKMTKTQAEVENVIPPLARR